MSVSQHVACRLRDLPTTSALENAARALGFDLKLDAADLTTHTGYLPARLGGRKAGFEWLLEPPSGHTEHVDAIADRDTVATLVTHADETEAQSATVCAAALLTLTRGVYFDEMGRVFTTAQPLVEEVNNWPAGGGGAGGEPRAHGIRKLLSRMLGR